MLCVFCYVLSLFTPFSTVSFHKTEKMRGFLCKKVLTFMQRGRIVCIVKGGNTSAANSIYTPHSGSYRAISKNRKEK